MWKAAFTGRSEKDKDRGDKDRTGSSKFDDSASAVSSGRRRHRSTSDGQSVISTTSRRTDGDRERRRKGHESSVSYGAAPIAPNTTTTTTTSSSSASSALRRGDDAPRGLTESAIRALNEDGEPEWEDERDGDGRSERRSTRGGGEKRRKSGRSDREREREGERSREREKERDGKRKEKVSSSDKARGKSRAEDVVDAPRTRGESDRAIPAMGSFEQFPGMYSAAVVGPQSHEPKMSGALPYDPHVSAQFPGQNPQTYAKPDFVPNPHGEAADYYNDQGESVQHQPGVRTSTPNMLRNPDTHLITPLGVAAPAQDTGHGAAADYYGTTAVPTTPSSSSKPSRPAPQNSNSSSGKSSKKPSKTSSSAAAVAATTAALGGVEAMSSHHHSQNQESSQSAYYNQQSTTGQSSYQQSTYSTPPKSNFSNMPKPLRHNSEPVSAPGGGYYTQPPAVTGRPGKSSPPRTNHTGLYTAAGAAAAGMAAYEMKQSYDQRHSERIDANTQYGAPPLPGPRPTSQYDYNGGPSYGQQGGAGSYYAPADPRGMPMGMQHRHEHKGPITKLKDGFLNLLSSPEDVRRMEEYTEYIGVCKYCFDPRSSPSDGPRQHHFHPRKRDSFESLRRRSAERLRRKGSGESLRRAGSKIEKESRYYSSGRKSASKTDLLAGGLAVAGTAAAANAMFNDRKDFDDTYSVKSGHRATSAVRRRSSSSSRERRRRTTHGVIGADRRDEYVTVRTRNGRLEQRRAHGSRSRSGDRKSGFMTAAAGAALGAGAASAASRYRRDSSPERVFVRHGEHQHRSRSRSHSPVLTDILGFGGSKTKRSGRRSPTTSQYERPAQSSGVLGNFFSPSSKSQKKEHRKKGKKSGSFFTFSNGSSSSSDSGMAFGEGMASRSSLGRTSSTKKRVSKKSSDERMNAAMLGLGATAAALAVAQNRNRISKKGSRTDLAARRDLRARQHAHVGHQHGSPGSTDEDGWEDEASEGSIDDGLAFGDNDARRRLSRQSMDSVASGKSSDGGLGAWGWRWGGKDKKRRRPSEPREDVYQSFQQPSSFAGPLAAGVAAGAVLDAYGRPLPAQSTFPSNDHVPQAPMQYVDPMPLSETGSRHASMPGAFDGGELPVIRPGPGPIQQPQPIAPIQPAFTQANYDSGMSATAGPSDAFRPTPRRSMSSPVRNGSGSFVQDAALIGGAALATASIIASQNSGRSKEPGRVSFGFTEEQQRKADAEHEREAKRERRSRALKEEAERFAREEDERRERAKAARENSQREAEAGRNARRERELEEDRQMRESREREEAYRREQARIAEEGKRRADEERERLQAEAEVQRKAQRDRELQAEIAAKQRELDEQDRLEKLRKRDKRSDSRERTEGRRERASSASSKSWQGPVAAATAGVLAGAVLDGALHKEARESVADRDHRDRDQHEERRDRPTYNTRTPSEPYIAKTIEPTNEHSGVPITDDDLIDPDFFKRRDRSPADLRRHSELARKAAEKVVAEREDYYNAPEKSQKDFFMPKELLDRAPEGKERVADPVGGNDVHVYSVGIDDVPRDVPMYGKAEQPLRRPGIPMLNVIAPTPPHSVAGSVKGDRSAPPSPLAKSADEEDAKEGARRPSAGRGVSWGEDKTHVYQVRTPDSYREDDRDGYITSFDIPPEARTPLDKDEIVVEAATPGGGEERTTYSANILPKGSESRDFYQRPFYESVSDFVTAPSPGTEGAPPVRGWVEGETDEPTPKEEKTPHIPGGFDDTVYEERTPAEPAWEPPLSKKDKKKKKGSKSNTFDSEPATPTESDKKSDFPIAAVAAAAAGGAAVAAALTSADEQGDYFTSSSSSKKDKKKAKKGAKAVEIFEDPPVNQQDPEPFPAFEEPAAPIQGEDEFAAPLSKKDKKKRDKAAKKGFGFDEDSTPSTPVNERVDDRDIVVQPEPGPEVAEWEPPLSKKEQKKKDKAAKNAFAFEEPAPSPPPIVEPEVVAAPVEEDVWAPPLSKKEQKKRDKEAAKNGFAFDEPASSSPAADRDVVEPPVEDVWEAPLSKKEQKKREKEAKKNLAFDEPATPPVAEREQSAYDDPVVQEVKSEVEAAWEPPLSKKEQKKRDKEAKKSFSFDDSQPSTPFNDPSQPMQAPETEVESAWEPPLSKKEQKKRDKEAKNSGFVDVAASMMTGAGIAAVVDAASKPAEEEDFFTSAKKSKKSKKKLGEPIADDPRDIEPPSSFDPVPTPNTNVLPGGWEESSSDAAREVSPTPYGEKEILPAVPDAPSPVDEFAGFDSKKSKKKKKRDSSRFNEPVASSPLRAEVAFDDYIGAPVVKAEEAYTNGHSKGVERTNGASPERTNGKTEEYFDDNKRVSESPRNMSPEDSTARSVVSAPSDESRRSKSGRSRRESDYYEDTPYAYDDSRSVAASEPAYESSKSSKRRSRTQDDDTASVVSSRSRREKDESPTSEKKKKGGLFGLFSRKSSDGVPLSKTSTKDSKDGKDGEEDEERRHRRHRRKHTGSEYGDEDDSRSVVSSSSRRHRDRDERDEDSRERHRHRRDDGGDDDDDDKNSRHGSESRHRRRHTDDNDEPREHRRHRSGTLDEARSEKDQSFLGMRVEDMPPLPASRPTSPLSAPLVEPSTTEEQGFGNLVSAETVRDGRGDAPLPQLEELNKAAESQDVVETREVPTIQDLPALPESRPESPTEYFARPGFAGRQQSSTAVPLRFRQPPGSPLQPKERTPSFSGPGMESPLSPNSASRIKSSRPRSSEFRSSGEFRPLYLVSRNSKIEDIEEQLPSLPSSKPSSRASSVQGSEDWHSAAESMTNSPVREKKLAIDTAEANKYKPEEDILGSQQTTPKASALPPLATGSHPRQAPQFYTWEDFQQDERLHDAEASQGDAPRDADVIDYARPPLSQRPSEDEQGILAKAAEEAGRQISPTRMSKKDKKKFKGLAAAAMLGGGAAAAAARMLVTEGLEKREDENAGKEESRGAREAEAVAAPVEIPSAEPLEEASEEASKPSKKKGKKGKSLDLAALPDPDLAPESPKDNAPAEATTDTTRTLDKAEPIYDEPEQSFNEPEDPEEEFFDPVPKVLAPKKKGKKGKKAAQEPPPPATPSTPAEPERRAEPPLNAEPDQSFEDWFGPATPVYKKGKKGKKGLADSPTVASPLIVEEAMSVNNRMHEPVVLGEDQIEDDFFGPSAPPLLRSKVEETEVVDFPAQPTQEPTKEADVTRAVDFTLPPADEPQREVVAETAQVLPPTPQEDSFSPLLTRKQSKKSKKKGKASSASFFEDEKPEGKQSTEPAQESVRVIGAAAEGEVTPATELPETTKDLAPTSTLDLTAEPTAADVPIGIEDNTEPQAEDDWVPSTSKKGKKAKKGKKKQSDPWAEAESETPSREKTIPETLIQESTVASEAVHAAVLSGEDPAVNLVGTDKLADKDFILPDEKSTKTMDGAQELEESELLQKLDSAVTERTSLADEQIKSNEGDETLLVSSATPGIQEATRDTLLSVDDKSDAASQSGAPEEKRRSWFSWPFGSKKAASEEPPVDLQPAPEVAEPVVTDAPITTHDTVLPAEPAAEKLAEILHERPEPPARAAVQEQEAGRDTPSAAVPVQNDFLPDQARDAASDLEAIRPGEAKDIMATSTEAVPVTNATAVVPEPSAQADDDFFAPVGKKKGKKNKQSKAAAWQGLEEPNLTDDVPQDIQPIPVLNKQVEPSRQPSDISASLSAIDTVDATREFPHEDVIGHAAAPTTGKEDTIPLTDDPLDVSTDPMSLGSEPVVFQVAAQKSSEPTTNVKDPAATQAEPVEDDELWGAPTTKKKKGKRVKESTDFTAFEPSIGPAGVSRDLVDPSSEVTETPKSHISVAAPKENEEEDAWAPLPSKKKGKKGKKSGTATPSFPVLQSAVDPVPGVELLDGIDNETVSTQEVPVAAFNNDDVVPLDEPPADESVLTTPSSKKKGKKGKNTITGLPDNVDDSKAETTGPTFSEAAGDNNNAASTIYAPGESSHIGQDQTAEDPWDAFTSKKKKKAKKSKDTASEPATQHGEVAETGKTTLDISTPEPEVLQPSANVKQEMAPVEASTAAKTEVQPEDDSFWGAVPSRKKGKKGKKGVKDLVGEPEVLNETTNEQDLTAATAPGLEHGASTIVDPEPTVAEDFVAESVIPEAMTDTPAAEPDDSWATPAKGKKAKKGKKDRQQELEVVEAEPARTLPTDDPPSGTIETVPEAMIEEALPTMVDEPVLTTEQPQGDFWAPTATGKKNKKGKKARQATFDDSYAPTEPHDSENLPPTADSVQETALVPEPEPSSATGIASNNLQASSEVLPAIETPVEEEDPWELPTKSKKGKKGKKSKSENTMLEEVHQPIETLPNEPTMDRDVEPATPEATASSVTMVDDAPAPGDTVDTPSTTEVAAEDEWGLGLSKKTKKAKKARKAALEERVEQIDSEPQTTDKTESAFVMHPAGRPNTPPLPVSDEQAELSEDLSQDPVGAERSPSMFRPAEPFLTSTENAMDLELPPKSAMQALAEPESPTAPDAETNDVNTDQVDAGADAPANTLAAEESEEFTSISTTKSKKDKKKGKLAKSLDVEESPSVSFLGDVNVTNEGFRQLVEPAELGRIQLADDIESLPISTGPILSDPLVQEKSVAANNSGAFFSKESKRDQKKAKKAQFAEPELELDAVGAAASGDATAVFPEISKENKSTPNIAEGARNSSAITPALEDELVDKQDVPADNNDDFFAPVSAKKSKKDKKKGKKSAAWDLEEPTKPAAGAAETAENETASQNVIAADVMNGGAGLEQATPIVDLSHDRSFANNDSLPPSQDVAADEFGLVSSKKSKKDKKKAKSAARWDIDDPSEASKDLDETSDTANAPAHDAGVEDLSSDRPVQVDRVAVGPEPGAVAVDLIGASVDDSEPFPSKKSKNDKKKAKNAASWAFGDSADLLPPSSELPATPDCSANESPSILQDPEVQFATTNPIANGPSEQLPPATDIVGSILGTDELDSSSTKKSKKDKKKAKKAADWSFDDQADHPVTAAQATDAVVPIESRDLDDTPASNPEANDLTRNTDGETIVPVQETLYEGTTPSIPNEADSSELFPLKSSKKDNKKVKRVKAGGSDREGTDTPPIVENDSQEFVTPPAQERSAQAFQNLEGPSFASVEAPQDYTRALDTPAETEADWGAFSTKKSKKDKKKAKKAQVPFDSAENGPDAPPAPAEEALDDSVAPYQGEPAGASQELVQPQDIQDMPPSGLQAAQPMDPILAETSVEPEDDFATSATRKSKKEKKKSKKGKAIEADEVAPFTSEAPAFEPAAEQSPAATAALVGTAAAFAIAARSDAKDEDLWAEAPTKLSKKDKRKGKKSGTATPISALDEPPTESTFLDNKLDSGPLENNFQQQSFSDATPVREADEIVEPAHEHDLTRAPFDHPFEPARADNNDIDFAATLAAGLADSGFDPNVVVEDPAFHRRASPPGQIAEADPEEAFTSTKKNKKGKGERASQATDSIDTERAQEAETSNNDFDAALSRGLQDSGFDAALLQSATAHGDPPSTNVLANDDSEFSFSKPTNKRNKKNKNRQSSIFNDSTQSPADLGTAKDLPIGQEQPGTTSGGGETDNKVATDAVNAVSMILADVDPPMADPLTKPTSESAVLPSTSANVDADDTELTPLSKKKGKKGRKDDRFLNLAYDQIDKAEPDTAAAGEVEITQTDPRSESGPAAEVTDFVSSRSTEDDSAWDQVVDTATPAASLEAGQDLWASSSKKKKGKKGKKNQGFGEEDASAIAPFTARSTLNPGDANTQMPASINDRAEDSTLLEPEPQDAAPVFATENAPGDAREIGPDEWALPTKKRGKKGKNSQEIWEETSSPAPEDLPAIGPNTVQAQDFATATDLTDEQMAEPALGIHQDTNIGPAAIEERSLEPAATSTPADQDDFGLPSKKKGKKGKKRAPTLDADLNPFIEPPQLASATDTAEASATETADPASAYIVGGEGELDVDDMDKAYKAYKKNKRKQKKIQATAGANLSADESAVEVEPPQALRDGSERTMIAEHTRSGHDTLPAIGSTPATNQRALPTEASSEHSPSTLMSPSSPTNKVHSVFPELKGVKRRTISSHSEEGDRKNVLLHTSEVSQSLPVTVEKAPSPVASTNGNYTPIEEAFQQSTEPKIASVLKREAPEDTENSQSNVGIGLVGVGAALGALASQGPDWSFDGLQDDNVITRDSGYHEGNSPTTKRSSVDRTSREMSSVHKSASRDSLRGRRSAEPLHIDTGSPRDWGLDVLKQRSTDEQQKLHARTPSYQTPLEPTSRNRASYLFSSPPEGLADNAQTPRGPITPKKQSEKPSYFQDRPSDANVGSSGRGLVSPTVAGPLSPRIPLDTIPEEFNAHKRNIAMSNIDAVAPDRSGKSLRRTDTPKTLREHALSPTVSRDSQASRSVSTPISDAIIPMPSDENRPAKRVVSDPRSSSVLSNRSSVSISQHCTPEERRTLSRTSDRSSTPTLRRVHLSGDLRAVSRASNRLGDTGSAVGARSSPKTIPFEPPPTPPLNDEDEFNAGASRAANMADVFQGYGDGQGSQVSPTRPPSMRKRQSMHIMELESKVDDLVSENRALQEAKQQSFDGERMQYEISQRDLQLHAKDNEIQQMSAMLIPLRQEVDRLMQINAGLTEANRNLVDDTNGRYATLQAEHSHAQQQWQSSNRELDSLRQEHGKLTSGMRDAIAAQLTTALADKDHEIRKLREELEIATERIRALQVQIQSSRQGDFLVGRDEDYFDGACQKLCQHVQQWVLRFSKVSDNRICRLSSDLRDDKIEARLDNALLDGSDVDKLLGDRVRRRDIFMSVVMTMVWEYVFTRYLFGMDREQRQKLKALEKILAEVGPARAVAQWRATTLTLLAKRPSFANQCKLDTEAVAHEIFGVLCALLPPPSSSEQQLLTSLQKVIGVAVDLSIEMRTQRSEYIMLPPLQPEYDTNGDLVRKVHFNASLMNERSGAYASNDELESERAIVKIVLFPLVVKKGDEQGEGEEEIVVCPAQVLVHKDGGKGRKVVRVMSGAMEIDDPRKSRQSLISNRPGSAQAF